MIPEKNPFRPSFGTSPQELIGRGFELHSFLTGLYEGVGSMNRAVLVSGARGVGKTVLLNEFEEVARGMGWVVVRAYADDSLVNRLVRTTIPQALAALDYGEAAGGVRRMVTGFSLAGIGSISSEVARNRPSPEPSLIGELRALAAAARQHEAGVLVTLDEIQAAHPEQLAHLATAIQDLMRDEYDVAFAAAGLTAGIESLLEHPGTTFMRRANRLELGLLDETEVAQALTATARAHGRPFDRAAAQRAAALSQGYPYLVQLAGALSWTRAAVERSSEITLGHVEAIALDLPRHMGNQVHKIALKGVPHGELGFLREMARLSGKYGSNIPTGEIARTMGKTPSGISVWRRNLIERDLIVPGPYGHVRFALPYLGEYLDSVGE